MLHWHENLRNWIGKVLGWTWDTWTWRIDCGNRLGDLELANGSLELDLTGNFASCVYYIAPLIPSYGADSKLSVPLRSLGWNI